MRAADLSAEDRAAIEREHVAYTDKLRTALGRELDQAKTAARRAQAALDELRSGAAYDIEYAEGQQGDDIARHLDDAARSVRAAEALHADCVAASQ